LSTKPPTPANPAKPAPLDKAKAETDKPKNFPLRRRTGTADFWLSTAATGMGMEDLEKLSEKDAVMLLAELQWGSTTEMACPHCGTFDKHYWTYAQLRWKCKCCDKRFSVTTNTVLADHKLSLVKLLKIVFSWSTAASGTPALKLRLDWNVAYATVFTLLHKFREGILRGFNTGLKSGVHEMDGMDVNGRRYKEKRNKTRGSSKAGKPKIPENLLKPADGQEMVGPPTPLKFDKTARQPVERRIMVVVAQRGVSDGKGASSTRVYMAKTESSATVKGVATKFGSADSIIVSDEDPSYAAFSGIFAGHKTINHSEGYSDGAGTSNNLAESFNARARRMNEGIYLSTSNKYGTSYGAEAAWRTDTRKLSTKERLQHLFRCALSVGLSRWFRGYTHGHHRKSELLIEGDEPALGRGRQEGWNPMYAR
jgi:transposase-like protein